VRVSLASLWIILFYAAPISSSNTLTAGNDPLFARGVLPDDRSFFDGHELAQTEELEPFAEVEYEPGQLPMAWQNTLLKWLKLE
jgi:hypothetical protein